MSMFKIMQRQSKSTLSSVGQVAVPNRRVQASSGQTMKTFSSQKRTDARPHPGHNFRHIRIFPDPASMGPADAMTASPSSLGHKLSLKALAARPDVRTAPLSSVYPFTGIIQQAAREGIDSPLSTLPYARQIQQSFGRHDISRVQAHLGPEATASTRAMHASAYATGSHVVFAGRPDLQTAAHEAAHVIQQRGGVQLEGGIGRVADVYEQHADLVAHQVTAGRSAEALLDRFAGRQSEPLPPESSVSTPIVQRKDLGQLPPKIAGLEYAISLFPNMNTLGSDREGLVFMRSDLADNIFQQLSPFLSTPEDIHAVAEQVNQQQVQALLNSVSQAVRERNWSKLYKPG